MEEQEIKTAAELETEARARAKAEIASEKTTSEGIPSGQPQVVKHNKPKGKRTLIVCILSLFLLAGLAIGGDYLMDTLKGDKALEKKETKAPPASSRANASNERQGMGKDLNPFEGEQEPETTDRQVSRKELPQPPVTFNKVTALANSGSSSPSSASSAASHPTGTANAADPASDAALAQCKKVLARAPDGKLYCPDTATGAAESGTQNDNIARVTGVTRLNLDPNLYIPVDRYIPCAMLKRFVSDVAGNITCQISEDVYSANHFVRLIPAGTVARGIYKTGTLKNGMGRMYIAWTELRTPEPGAMRIPLIDSQAVGQLGENGIAGWIDEHWGDRIGNTILLATTQDFAAAVAGSSPGKDRNTDYTENTRSATAEMAKTVLENSINIPPTMYLNQGDVIGIATGADIDFSSVWQLHAR
ncbi:VirB10/TraB/TrbI family type IV secretion system protein [Buttiauxella ferragutiae]|uniref:VirB10/TraB/TrbI family type IV secretion system protein n=1 Tax=Buttiauxella ferragutiae TaxID=82989 RepID=UPI003523B6CF